MNDITKDKTYTYAEVVELTRDAFESGHVQGRASCDCGLNRDATTEELHILGRVLA